MSSSLSAKAMDISWIMRRVRAAIVPTRYVIFLQAYVIGLFLNANYTGSYRSAINSTKAWASNSRIDGEILEFLRPLLGVIC